MSPQNMRKAANPSIGEYHRLLVEGVCSYPVPDRLPANHGSWDFPTPVCSGGGGVQIGNPHAANRHLPSKESPFSDMNDWSA